MAVPLLVDRHAFHRTVKAWRAGRRLVIPAHALAETYSVLTRLPGDLRLLPGDAARLLDARFATVLPLAAATTMRLPSLLAEGGIGGGAVFDALVALAAVEHDATLASRDARARETYERVGATVVMVS